ncbi:MAG: hypothetical protein ACKVS8_10155 [Phycisphaerales bacterium]
MARSSALSSLSVGELQREISKRQRSVGVLQRKRAKLMKRVDAIDAQIAANGGPARAGRRPGSGLGMGAATRANNAMNLVESLARALKGKTMSVTEVSEVVQKAGYSTYSPNFRTIVNAALLKEKKRFKRVGRGQYTAA